MLSLWDRYEGWPVRNLARGKKGFLEKIRIEGCAGPCTYVIVKREILWLGLSAALEIFIAPLEDLACIHFPFI